ncbi:MAG: flagellar motor protein MotB [Thermodesulfobacteriota bacterium]|nr:flagellar motor protein MotB [Thermodesulfobacteriota bacterium]
MSEDKIKAEEAEEGAPAWVVTFGDLMSLLLCFFVLLLSFSEMDAQKYKEVAGALAKAFGLQRETKAFDSPKGMKIIARDFDRDLVPTKKASEVVATQKTKSLGEELKKEVETRFRGMQDMIEVVVQDNAVTVRLMGETAFNSAEARIRQPMIPLLEKIGTGLNDTKGDITIAGHTDDRPIRGGKYRSNLRLSIARATSVAEFFLLHTSIDPKRISTMGFGEYRPLVPNDTAKGRAKNRRVEIVLRNAPATKQAEQDDTILVPKISPDSLTPTH